MNNCKHPPKRLYSWFVIDPETGESIFCVGCCECGKILSGEVNE